MTENGAAGRPSALVWVGKADHEALRRASLAGTPIVGLTEGESLPYVLDTNLVLIRPGQGLPIADVAVALARVLGPNAPGLAARLPVLRPAVVDRLIRGTVRKNALIGAAAFIPGADLPALTLNEALLAIRIAVAGGRDADRRCSGRSSRLSSASALPAGSSPGRSSRCRSRGSRQGHDRPRRDVGRRRSAPPPAALNASPRRVRPTPVLPSLPTGRRTLDAPDVEPRAP